MEKVLTTGQLLTWLDDNHSSLWEHWQNKNPLNVAPIHFTDWKYARLEQNEKIMQQTPELGMFVPCVDGEPIKKPTHSGVSPLLQESFEYEKKQYKQAKSQVLFDKCKLFENGRYVIINGISVDVRKGLIWNKARFEISNIEDLAKEVDLTPTKAFLDKIGIKNN